MEPVFYDDVEDRTSKENNYEQVDKKIILSAAKYWCR